MKRDRVVHALIAAALVVSCIGRSAAQLPGSEAPDFVLKSVSGENLRLSEYRGRVVMLSFLASWCGDCRSQLAGLADLRDRYAAAGFELLAVSLDANRGQAADVAGSLRAGYPVLHDAGGEVGRLYAVDSMPLAVLIDREGVVREVFEGHRRGNEKRYVERVRALLSE
jgi:peroxiredoxin